MRVAVIGAGIMGLLTSRYLAAEGCDILLFDKDAAARESSWAGGGILSPLYPWRYPMAISQLVQPSWRLYSQLVASLLSETGIDAEMDRWGMWVQQVDDVSVAHAWADQCGVPIQTVTAETISEKTLGRIAPVGDMVWMPDVGAIRNPRLLKALLVASRCSKRISIFEHHAIEEICIHKGRVTGVRVTGQTHAVDAAVLTSGAWSGNILESAGLKANIAPVRGQMIAIQAPPRFLTHLALRDGIYVIPRRDGTILVGSTVEYGGFSKHTTEEARHMLAHRAADIIVGLDEWPVVHHWTGLRPGSDTGIPMIGRIPSVQGLYVNVGHFRNGLVTAPASCHLAADILLGKSTMVDGRPYDPCMRL